MAANLTHTLSQRDLKGKSGLNHSIYRGTIAFFFEIQFLLYKGSLVFWGGHCANKQKKKGPAGPRFFYTEHTHYPSVTHYYCDLIALWLTGNAGSAFASVIPSQKPSNAQCNARDPQEGNLRLCNGVQLPLTKHCTIHIQIHHFVHAILRSSGTD